MLEVVKLDGCSGTGTCFLVRLGGGTTPCATVSDSPPCVEESAFEEAAGVIEETLEEPEARDGSDCRGGGGRGS